MKKLNNSIFIILVIIFYSSTNSYASYYYRNSNIIDTNKTLKWLIGIFKHDATMPDLHPDRKNQKVLYREHQIVFGDDKSFRWHYRRSSLNGYFELKKDTIFIFPKEHTFLFRVKDSLGRDTLITLRPYISSAIPTESFKYILVRDGFLLLYFEDRIIKLTKTKKRFIKKKYYRLI